MANWSIRYGASLRKRYTAISKEKRKLYQCEVCSKEAVKRISTGIWKCKHCGAIFAGGAYSLKTETGKTVERLLNQIKK
ncbi:MAG: 50S ribosomal protein L37ae [Candidatus Micrarchaeales archaeon]|jgi:large subunit ribosomal protein L37Ae